MFHVGQKVVCVNNSPYNGHDGYLERLQCGRVYTVRSCGEHNYIGFGIFPSVWLDEIRRTIEDEPYGCYRFRPVHTTNISIFQAMLVPTPKEKVGA